MFNFILGFIGGMACGAVVMMAITRYLTIRALASRAPIIAGGGGTGEEQVKPK
jgi:hypothetical protein